MSASTVPRQSTASNEPGPYAAKFAGPYTHRTIDGGIGHNLPQQAPAAFADAVLELGGAK